MYHNFFLPSILLLPLPNYNSINFFYFSWLYQNYKPQEYYILTMRSLPYFHKNFIIQMCRNGNYTFPRVCVQLTKSPQTNHTRNSHFI